MELLADRCSTDSRPRPQSNKRKVRFLNAKSARRLQKPKPVETPYFVTKAEAEWFRSLPLKVRQLHFSPEEQARLAGTWCRPTSIILDSADKALYRLGEHQRRHSLASISSAPTLSDASTMASSSTKDSAIDMADVYDSFRWMDEEEELDLKLYDYHHHLADLSKKPPRRPRDSFRRTFSLRSFQQSGSSTPTSVRPPLRKTATDWPGPSPIRHRNHSFSRSVSSICVLKSAPQPSEPSSDRPAQYYQDPEARLKLRVYLASPQKFDEAIEFGFPSLEYSKDNQPPSRPSSSRRNRPSDGNSSTGTFFQSESTLPTERPNTPIESPQKFQPTVLRPSPSRLSQHLSGGREMTLKMTLTRADLRTDVESSSVRTSDVSEEHDDPLRLADLPPVGGHGPVWDEPGQGGVVKKMWSKLKRRR